MAHKYDFDFAIDIQGDEPLVNPYHIDLVSESISKIKNEDIIIPTLEVPYTSPETIVRVQSSLTGRIMTLSWANIPIDILYSYHYSKTSFSYWIY